MYAEQDFSALERLSFATVFADACKECDLQLALSQYGFSSQLKKNLQNDKNHQQAPQQQRQPCSSNQQQAASAAAKPDKLLVELNKIFFQTLLRYENARRENYLELADGSFVQLSQLDSVKNKLIDLLSRLVALFKTTGLELEGHGVVDALTIHCQTEQANLDLMDQLVTMSAQKDGQLHDLIEKVTRLEREIDTDDESVQKSIAMLKHEFQELKELSSMLLAYRRKGQEAAFERDQSGQAEEMRRLNSQIDDLKIQLNKSNRVYSESESWLLANMSRLNNLDEYTAAMQEVEMLTEKLDQLKVVFEGHQKDHEELKQEYDRCDQLVASNRSEMEAIRLRDEFSKKFLQSVLQIQCWWRTTIETRNIKLKRKKGKKKKDVKKTD